MLQDMLDTNWLKLLVKKKKIENRTKKERKKEGEKKRIINYELNVT